MTDSEVSIDLVGADEAGPLAPDISRLYREVFSEAPFFGSNGEFQGQAIYYMQMRRSTGFQLAVARYGTDYVGFVYGYLLPASTGWWKTVSPPVPEHDAVEDGHRTFVIIDFGVLPQYRGRGIGKKLHDAVLMASSANRATLTVQEVAQETRAIYDRWGWEDIGSKGGTLGDKPVVFRVYVKTLSESGQGLQGRNA